MSYRLFQLRVWAKEKIKKSPFFPLIRRVMPAPSGTMRNQGAILSDHSPNAGWESALDSSMAIEGMLTRLDAAAMVAILELQRRSELRGGLAEFGTFKGRTAALLASYAREVEPLYLVDIAEYLETEKIAALKPNLSFVRCDSAHFIEIALSDHKKRHEFVAQHGIQSFRFIHADGSHTYQNVFHDLKVADKLLTTEGILVMDDYFNPHYPQVAAAIYSYLSTQRTDLRVFLVGGNKCMLCRKEFHSKMMRFALNDFPKFMVQFGQPVQISKTDSDKAFDCYSYKRRNIEKGDDEYYGTKIYHRYY